MVVVVGGVGWEEEEVVEGTYGVGGGVHKLFKTSFSSLKKQSKQNCPEQFPSSQIVVTPQLKKSMYNSTVAGPVIVLEVALRNHCRLTFLIKQNELLVGSFPG